MNGLKVESKAATLCSSKRTRKGPEKLKKAFPSALSFLPSADLDLSEVQGGTGEATSNGDCDSWRRFVLA
jgi:hypothetical protein